MSQAKFCYNCEILKKDLLAEKENTVEKIRQINSLTRELNDIKTSLRILLRSVDRYNE